MTESGGTNREPSVLVVDDDLTFLGVITEALSPVARCDIEVTGRAALQRMQHSAFDVVLLDLGLPDIGGIEVLRCLRIHRSPVPVVLVSGAGSIASAVAAMKLGAHDFIEKPVVLADLLDIVRSFMPLSSPSSGRSMPVEAIPSRVSSGPWESRRTLKKLGQWSAWEVEQALP